MKHLFYILLFCIITLLSAEAGSIKYHKEKNCIIISDFPEDAPATLDTILEADKKNLWGKVTYEKKTDKYTIDSNLWIGDNKSLGTYVQIGNEKHPTVTLVIKGSIWIYPPQESVKRIDGRYSIMNRLTIGAKENKNIKATVKFDCRKRGEYALVVGQRYKTIIKPRGSLHVFNSTVTAAIQDNKHKWSNIYKGYSSGCYGSDIIIENSHFSYFDECLFYGQSTGNLDKGNRTPLKEMKANPFSIIKNSTFENGGSVVRNGVQYLENCTFTDMNIAIAEGGALAAKAVNCMFKDNNYNWTLGSITSKGILLVDCKISPQKQPLWLKKNRKKISWFVPQYPTCRIQESIVFKIISSERKGIANAIVNISCKENPKYITNGFTLTNDTGETPRGLGTACIITKKRYQATDNPQKPKEETFNYTVTVTAPGFRKSEIKFNSTSKISEPFVIKMDK